MPECLFDDGVVWVSAYQIAAIQLVTFVDFTCVLGLSLQAIDFVARRQPETRCLSAHSSGCAAAGTQRSLPPARLGHLLSCPCRPQEVSHRC